ncbi:MAG TPA: DUF2490 domain-containing protein [Flavobacteriales bacterium]|nr:DUF2490 domain-containing protein [Flavobacteriales bacterium]
MIKRLYILILVAGFLLPAQAQRGKTFENWFSGAAQIKSNDFTFTIEEGWRIRELYMSRQNYTDLNFSYKFNKHFSASAGYRLALKTSMFNISEVNNRLYLDATGSYEVGEIDFSIRLRYQYTSLGQEDDFSLPSETFFRNRFRAKLKINDMFSVSASYEMLLIMGPGLNILTENRPALELQCKINKKNSISAGYLIRNYVQIENPMNIHVVGIDYVYKF